MVPCATNFTKKPMQEVPESVIEPCSFNAKNHAFASKFSWFLEFLSRCACGIHFQILTLRFDEFDDFSTLGAPWCALGARSFQRQCSRNSASDPSHGWRAWNSEILRVSSLDESRWVKQEDTPGVPQKLGVGLSVCFSLFQCLPMSFLTRPSWRFLAPSCLGLTQVLVRTSRLCWTGVDRVDKRCYKICSSFKRPGLLQARGRLSVLPCAKRLDLQS